MLSCFFERRQRIGILQSVVEYYIINGYNKKWHDNKLLLQDRCDMVQKGQKYDN